MSNLLQVVGFKVKLKIKKNCPGGRKEDSPVFWRENVFDPKSFKLTQVAID